MSMRHIEYSKEALQFLRKINKRDAMNITKKINQYAECPLDLQNNVKKVVGTSLYRLRVGRYRVIFDEDGTVLYILKIGLRENIYEEIKKWI